jgi:DegV family protein with EDD domain
MKIRYLNGKRLYYAFLAGGQAVIRDKDYLNRINVFPVADADTGTNLASTMRSIATEAKAGSSLRDTLRSLADAALVGARGNSGLIFAQFVHGLSREAANEPRLTTHTFGEMMARAVRHAYNAILHPVEGTMLSVMRDWADSVFHYRLKTADFTELLSHSLLTARRSLRDTPRKLSVLARARVVDAGAKGFVDFVEGVMDFIRAGRLRSLPKQAWPENHRTLPKVHSFSRGLGRRYCAEAVLVGRDMDLDRLRRILQAHGDSAIVAGSEEKARFHIHTDRPADLFYELRSIGMVRQIKVDDMLRQMEAGREGRRGMALVTDSACDLPPRTLDKHGIHVLPFTLSFGEDEFLDRLTIQPEQFYRLLRKRPEHPVTSLPSPTLVHSQLSFLTDHYESVLIFSISSGLSGACDAIRRAAADFPEAKISVIDTKTLSASQGLLVLRAAEAARGGAGHEEIVRLAEEWSRRTRLLVDVQTLRYMVRGGRVSPFKGFLARLLNLKPIVSLDENGKAVAWGKSFGRRANLEKILKMAAAEARERKLWNYAVVHALNRPRAEMYGRRLESLLGRPPVFIQDIAPVIGAHNGIGVVGVCLMFE